MHAEAEQVRRKNPAIEIPSIWLIPLLEDTGTVRGIRSYLDRVWDYATQSRQSTQSVQTRFGEIVPEIFIAGSDLSQHEGQPAGALIYCQGKFEIQTWLAEHGVAESTRIKLGSGEPMQRQGGYYSRHAGQAAFLNTDANRRRIAANLPASARKSTIMRSPHSWAFFWRMICGRSRAIFPSSCATCRFTTWSAYCTTSGKASAHTGRIWCVLLKPWLKAG
jgi:hypothetical protein